MKNGSPCSVSLQAVTLTVVLYLNVTSSLGSPCAAQRALKHETLPSAAYWFSWQCLCIPSPTGALGSVFLPVPTPNLGMGWVLAKDPKPWHRWKDFKGRNLSVLYFPREALLFQYLCFGEILNYAVRKTILKPNAKWSFKPSELKSFLKDEPYCQSSPECSLTVRNKLTNAVTMNLDFSVYELHYLLPMRHSDKMAIILSSSWTEVQLLGILILVN